MGPSPHAAQSAYMLPDATNFMRAMYVIRAMYIIRAKQGITWDSSRQPWAGVTSFMLTTCSSTGGMVAPDPWLPTWVNPPMVCSLMLAKFCRVRPCGRNASTTFRNRMIVSDNTQTMHIYMTCTMCKVKSQKPLLQCVM